MALIEKLTAIADAIRGKTGKTEGLTLDRMATEIAGIQSGGGLRFDILHTVEITEPVSAVQFDWNTAWNEYTYFYVVPESLEMSAPEWLCYRLWSMSNGDLSYHYIGTSGTGGGLSLFDETRTTQVMMIHNGYGYNFRGDTVSKIGSVKQFSHMTFAPYYSPNVINSGKIHIYGGK